MRRPLIRIWFLEWGLAFSLHIVVQGLLRRSYALRFRGFTGNVLQTIAIRRSSGIRCLWSGFYGCSKCAAVQEKETGVLLGAHILLDSEGNMLLEREQ